MTSDKQLDEFWRKMVMLDAEYELAERGLNMIVEEYGLSSPEAAEALQRLNRLGERLVQMDEAYSEMLKEAGWLPGAKEESSDQK